MCHPPYAGCDRLVDAVGEQAVLGEATGQYSVRRRAGTGPRSSSSGLHGRDEERGRKVDDDAVHFCFAFSAATASFSVLGRRPAPGSAGRCRRCCRSSSCRPGRRASRQPGRPPRLRSRSKSPSAPPRPGSRRSTSRSSTCSARAGLYEICWSRSRSPSGRAERLVERHDRPLDLGVREPEPSATA